MRMRINIVFSVIVVLPLCASPSPIGRGGRGVRAHGFFICDSTNPTTTTKMPTILFTVRASMARR